MSRLEPITAASGPAGALPAAAGWIEGVLLGSVGTAVAILAIAGMGFVMLQGRLSTRAIAKVVLGCFILFGAPTIAKALFDSTRMSAAPVAAPAAIAIPSYAPPPSPRANPDPYAGAAVPMQ